MIELRKRVTRWWLQQRIQSRNRAISNFCTYHTNTLATSSRIGALLAANRRDRLKLRKL